MKNQSLLLPALALFLTTGVFADNSPATPAPAAIAPFLSAPDQITFALQPPGSAELTSFAKLTSVEVAPGPAVKLITESVHGPRAAYQAGDGPAKADSYQVLPDASSFPTHAAAPVMVFSMPPSPVFNHDRAYPASWYPSVSFRFDFGRGHRS